MYVYGMRVYIERDGGAGVRGTGAGGRRVECN